MKKYSGYLIGSVLGGLMVYPFVGSAMACFAAFMSFVSCVIIENVIEVIHNI